MEPSPKLAQFVIPVFFTSLGLVLVIIASDVTFVLKVIGIATVAAVDTLVARRRLGSRS